MALGLVGKKSGMTRIFNEEGVSVPVTVIEAEPNRITQVKSVESDGYTAVQVTTGERRLSRVSKPMAAILPRPMPELAAVSGNFVPRLQRLDVAANSRSSNSPPVSRLMFKASLRVKVMPAPLSAGISVVKTTPTVTRSPTVPPDQLANARPQVECSKAKRCLARWVMCV